MSERTRRILTGLIFITTASAITILGVYAGAGKFSAKYRISGRFSSAGQGLISGSDVKIHGINIGSVTSVKLVQGEARVSMKINDDQKIPRDASATIRPKTLFGEKFVDIDPGPNEAKGPFLDNHGVIRKTTGGFELEKVLTDLYPILKAVKPEDLTVVLDTLGQAGQGLGPTINREIVNSQKVADVNARHAVETQQFLDDLVLLSDQLNKSAPDLIGGAKDLNVALPELNANAQNLADFLDQASRLSVDVSELLENNRSFLVKNITEGGKTLQLLYDKRGRIGPLVTGLRQFFEVLSEAADRIPDPSNPGTTMAAVKLVFGGGPPCGRGFGPPPGCVFGQQDPNNPPPTAPPSSASTSAAPGASAASTPAPLPAPAKGVQAITQLVGGLVK